MKTISALAALTVAALGLAAPAHADDTGRGRVSIAGYSGSGLCEETLALVPWALPLTGPAVDDACRDRDHEEMRDRAAGPALTP
ncbi:hypothetical protein SZN_09908 [Streptomyces zinciresistens K42]|uniref:Secreted protein n=1 Tax=Streptomyces zinciresistens K42 TaxID=700597 RepID=G2G911_9ACTN|nr:hypothetical protein [Streptomyces zinciresistens]EGX59960.1 hypothetical protein SZN_09908 [Streptomyces zinciresistens K42]